MMREVGSGDWNNLVLKHLKQENRIFFKILLNMGNLHHFLQIYCDSSFFVLLIANVFIKL